MSLAVAAGGALAAHVAARHGPLAGQFWMHIVADGFEAGVVGGLADWFAVTALFRRPLGLPIPHTDIIRANRKKLSEGIKSTVQNQWLSPEVIRARLDRVAPGDLLLQWLADPAHAERLGGWVRGLVRELARSLGEEPVTRFAERVLVEQLRALPVDASAGRWLARAVDSPAAGETLRSLALSLVRFAERPRTAQELHWWLLRSASALRQQGKRLVPMLLRMRFVQRRVVDAALGYAAAELRDAADDPAHPLRRFAVEGLHRYAGRLAAGEPEAIAQLERVRAAVLESVEAGPLVRRALEQLRAQIENELGDPQSSLSRMIDERMKGALEGYLAVPAQRDAFDRRIRELVIDFVGRNHHQIGETVEEALAQLSDEELVRQIESKVGSDLQFIRLNGALVGGLIGLVLSLLRTFAG